MTRVLLTGGSGMLGQAIMRHAPDSWHIKAPTRQDLDLTNQSAVKAYFNTRMFDLVIHTAAKVGGIKANINDQAGFYATNAAINLNIIEGAQEANIKTLINLGSSCMYPRNHNGLLREEDLLTAPLEPTNEGYALAKISAAKHCQYVSQQYGLHYKTLIPCNLYGVGDTFDPVGSHLIPAIILKIHTALQEGINTIEIWGDGTARREFIYVDDLASFITRNAHNAHNWPDMLNCGLGHDHSINDYYTIAANVLGFTGTFTRNLNAPIGMQQKLMDSSTARALGWTPQTTLEDGIQKTYTAFKSCATKPA